MTLYFAIMILITLLSFIDLSFCKTKTSFIEGGVTGNALCSMLLCPLFTFVECSALVTVD